MAAPSEKRFLKGTCQWREGCTKKVRHLRGHADIRVAWIDYLVVGLCGEHTARWDEEVEARAKSLPADNPRHAFPSSSILAYHLKAERLAAEQEEVERAERAGRRAARPVADSIRARNARAPRVVRLS